MIRDLSHSTRSQDAACAHSGPGKSGGRFLGWWTWWMLETKNDTCSEAMNMWPILLGSCFTFFWLIDLIHAYLSYNQRYTLFTIWWIQPFWKILYSQIGSFPQNFGVTINNIWNHHLVSSFIGTPFNRILQVSSNFHPFFRSRAPAGLHWHNEQNCNDHLRRPISTNCSKWCIDPAGFQRAEVELKNVLVESLVPGCQVFLVYRNHPFEFRPPKSCNANWLSFSLRFDCSHFCYTSYSSICGWLDCRWWWWWCPIGSRTRLVSKHWNGASPP